MQFSKFKRVGMLTAAAVASLQAATAWGVPTIYFTGATGSPPVAGLPQLNDSGTATGNSAKQGFFTPSAANPSNSVLLVTGGNGYYVPGYVNDINSSGSGGAVSDYLQIGGFHPSDDNIFIALKLDNGSTPIPESDTSDIEQIDSDINASFGTSIASPMSSSGAFNNVFAGYDVLLSFPSSFIDANSITAGTGSDGQYAFGFDFTGYSNDSGQISVTDIGVVPEPGCLGILTAAGWVLFPRYRRYRRA